MKSKIQHPVVVSLAVFTLISLFGYVRQTSAGIAVFTDRGAWEASFGGLPDLLVDFDSFAVDAQFRTVPVDAGPFSLQQVGSESSALNIIDALPIDSRFDIDGTPYALMRVEGDKQITVDMTFDEPILAWGADFRTPDLGGGVEEVDIEILFSDATTEAMQLVPSSFNGFVTMPLHEVISITFKARIADGSSTRGENFGMDNVIGSVPEPATICLLGLGGLATLRRKRRA